MVVEVLNEGEGRKQPKVVGGRGQKMMAAGCGGINMEMMIEYGKGESLSLSLSLFERWSFYLRKKNEQESSFFSSYFPL